MKWDRRACKDEDPRIFFDPASYDEALALCHVCPVQVPCQELRHQVEVEVKGPAAGVWGGQVWTEVSSQQRARQSDWRGAA